MKANAASGRKHAVFDGRLDVDRLSRGDEIVADALANRDMATGRDRITRDRAADDHFGSRGDQIAVDFRAHVDAVARAQEIVRRRLAVHDDAAVVRAVGHAAGEAKRRDGEQRERSKGEKISHTLAREIRAGRYSCKRCVTPHRYSAVHGACSMGRKLRTSPIDIPWRQPPALSTFKVGLTVKQRQLTVFINSLSCCTLLEHPNISKTFVTKNRPLCPIVVLAIDNDAMLRAAKLRAAQSATDHLFVEHLAHCRSGHDYMCDHRGVEPRREHLAVTQDLDVAILEFFYDAPTCHVTRVAANERARNAVLAKQEGHAFRIENGWSEVKHFAVRLPRDWQELLQDR